MGPHDFHITIPKPCHENWDKMTPDEKGKFCSVCNKTVTDFSSHTKEQVIASLEKTGYDVCGRFPSAYISRVVSYEKTRVNSFRFFQSILAIVGLSGLFMGDAHAQNTVQDSTLKETVTTSTIETIRVRGIVKDSKTKKPLDYVSIVAEIDHKVIGSVLTNDDGEFKITLPISQNKDTLTLKVSNVRYTPLIMKGIPLTITDIIILNMEAGPPGELISVGGPARIPMFYDGTGGKIFRSDELRRMGY
jgi:hypothetical protein